MSAYFSCLICNTVHLEGHTLVVNVVVQVKHTSDKKKHDITWTLAPECPIRCGLLSGVDL